MEGRQEQKEIARRRSVADAGGEPYAHDYSPMIWKATLKAGRVAGDFSIV